MNGDFMLDDVHVDDRNLVHDVLSLLRYSHKQVKTWIVSPQQKWYDVVVTLDTKNGDWEVFYDDLDLVRQLDVFRIPIVSVRTSGGLPQIRVQVMRKSERVVMQTTEVIRVYKKRKWCHVV